MKTHKANIGRVLSWLGAFALCVGLGLIFFTSATGFTIAGIGILTSIAGVALMKDAHTALEATQTNQGALHD